MEREKFLLLDADYVTRNSEPVIRLFGKLPSGRSIIALDRNFRPYIYVLPYHARECMDELRDLGLLNLDKIWKKDSGLDKEFIKIILNHPQDLSQYMDKIRNLKSVKDTREYDIPFEVRYLIDKGLYPMSEVEIQGKVINQSSFNKARVFEIQGESRQVKSSLPGFKILSFKIDICTPQGVPRASEEPINIISFSSNQDFFKVFSTKESSLDFVEFIPNEEELIEKFMDTIQGENPDIILGYNSDKFDFPYLKERAGKLGIKLNLGVDGSGVKFRTGRIKAASVKGRVHVDLYKIVRRHFQLNSHTIGNVYLELFREHKIDIPGEDICKYWNTGDEQLERLFKYSLEDVMAVTKIGEMMLPMSIELTRIVGQPLFEIARRGTGTQVKWYLMRKSHELGHILPNEFGKFERNVVGGYVEEPVKGLHENIFYFDFRSLYPSIIVAKNISPDTLTPEGDEDTCHITPEFGYKFKKEPMGFIPSVTAQILKERIRIKALMKETEEPRERLILNFRQKALKTLISTVYGLFNHPTYRWYSIEASEAITAWGREFLQKTMDNVEKHGFKVLYADTDGFYAKIDQNR